MRIGILGGTFDPVHAMHTGLACRARDALCLDRVLFVLAANPPHKSTELVLNADRRMEMLSLALAPFEGLEPCDVELKREGVSYTCDTVEELRHLYPDAELIFLLGSDMLKKLPDWRGADRLLKILKFGVFSRPGQRERDEAQAAELRRSHGADIVLVDADAADISSTEIRSRVGSGSSIRGMVDPAVEAYIYENGIYFPEKMEWRRQKLAKALSASRYRHVSGVVSQAAYLAELYAPGDGALKEKAAFAALLHDCAKELPKPVLGVLSGDDYPEIGPVQHALAGSVVARYQYGVEDQDVLRAIRLHCTGDASMALLDEITYLADLTEPGRNFPGADAYREALKRGPHEAMAFALEGQMAHMAGNACHPATLRAYEAYCKK